MSQSVTDCVWYPPAFPAQGRLPSQARQVGENLRKQESLERAYLDQLCLAAGRRCLPPCCKTLHISLFFDGTGNNLNTDMYEAEKAHPTNIARLFLATIGNGTAGGVSDIHKTQLLDADPAVVGRYFKYYVPGVGTPFPEIDDPGHYATGQGAGSRGEDRINWALLRIIDTLKRSLGDPSADHSKLSEKDTRKALKNMATTWPLGGLTGYRCRHAEFARQLNKLQPQLRQALLQPEPGKPKLLGLKLYVYGFSRGAAEARAFVNWLNALLEAPKAGDAASPWLPVGDLRLPVSVEFLGLLDTVASVGLPHILPFVDGHLDWADGTMVLPEEKTGLIKRCVHFVAAHEQRGSFPLDSIRRSDGRYPAGSVEVVYPGMHSDIGGGYPPGEQGKANAEHDGFLLSQIVLHDLYACAFAAGAPLKVPERSFSKVWKNDLWRMLSDNSMSQLVLSPELIARFNAWRELTLNLPADKTSLSADEATHYRPVRAAVSLEKAVERQMAWLTAWRIHRYAHGSLRNTAFCQRAERQQAIQLVEAAQDFQAEYESDFHVSRAKVRLTIFSVMVPPAVSARLFAVPLFALDTVEDNIQRKRMKAAGEEKMRALFADGDVTSSSPSGLLRALFDDQVHDSRASFLYDDLSLLTGEKREPNGSYFRYRTLFFDTVSNKQMALVLCSDNPDSALCRMIARVTVAVEHGETHVELKDGAGQPIALPGGKVLSAFTSAPGGVLSRYRQQQQTERLANVQRLLQSGWLKDVDDRQVAS